MDCIHFYVLIGLVERDATCDTGKIRGPSQAITNRLGILTAALHHVGDQHDLIVSVSIEMRRVTVELALERADKIANQRTLIGWVELHDPNVANRRFAGLLFEPEW